MDTRKVSKPPYKILVFVLATMAFCSFFSAEGKKAYPSKSGSALQQAQIVDIDPSEIMKDLIQTHPHPEIRHQLNELILRREIGLSFQRLQGAPNTIANVVYGQSADSGKKKLSLNYTLEDLFSPKESKIYKQLIIYHEWIHIKQQREGRFPAWLAGLGELPSSLDELRKTLIAAETEAYTAQCKLAIDLGVAQEFDFCQAYSTKGRKGLDETILKELQTRLP